MRAPQGKFRIRQEEARFLDAAIQSPSHIVRKQALQRLCSLYRGGGRLTAPRSMKALVLQALTDTNSKVRRWAFNSLAQLGEPSDVDLMITPWQGSRNTPDVFEAGLTALAHLLPKEKLLRLLGTAQVELDPSVVMALGQQTNDFADELAALRLDIDRASVAELRSATLLIGLRKAPNTLFSGRFPVSDVIGDLNTHPDPIVAQYSFWATVEHPSLGLANVRVPPTDFRRLPVNVQAWAYRTLTGGGSPAAAHYELITDASQSVHAEVREGVAIGIREVFYDSIDTMVRDWFIDETDAAIKEHLLEHMAAYSASSSFYREEVLAAYRAAAPASIARSRLEAANRDEEVSLAMRKLALQTGDPDLFASMVAPVTNNQTFTGQMNVGGISNLGPGNIGPVQFMTGAEAQTKAASALDELRRGLSDRSTPAVAETLKAVTEASEAPTKGKVARVVELLKGLKDGGEAVVGIGDLVGRSYDQLQPLLEHLPAAI